MRRGVLVLLGACSFQIGGAPGRDAAPTDDGDPMTDASIDSAIDAAIDAPPLIDAPSSVCSTAGLACPAGTTPHLIPCAGLAGCWVGCKDGSSVDYAGAAALCATWGGKLGWIDSAAESTCLRMTLDGAIMIGLGQSALAVTPGMSWTWNGDLTPPIYTDWAPGQPSDGDGVENGAEQCAYSSSSVTWQDEACNLTHTRFSCRR